MILRGCCAHHYASQLLPLAARRTLDPRSRSGAGRRARSCSRALSTSGSRTYEPQPPTSARAEDTLSPLPFPVGRTIPMSKELSGNSGMTAEERAAKQAAFDRIPVDYLRFRDYQREVQGLGADVSIRYLPGEVFKRPPADATLEMLLAAQAHLGHNTSLWNPANARYIFGVRAGVHIISLETIAAHLRRAARVVEEVAYNGGLILFVGNRRGHMPITVRAAALAGACHLFSKWTPGTITNRDQLMNDQLLQVVDVRDNLQPGWDQHLAKCRPLAPDLVVCLNPIENYTLLYECGYANIPTIGIIDTNADPTWVTYQIPCNDDSLRAVALVAMVLGRAGGRGQKRRLDVAAKGFSTWENTPEIQTAMGMRILRQREEKAARKRTAEAGGGSGRRESLEDAGVPR